MDYENETSKFTNMDSNDKYVSLLIDNYAEQLRQGFLQYKLSITKKF